MTFRSMKAQASLVLCIGALLGALVAAGQSWLTSSAQAQAPVAAQPGQPKEAQGQPETPPLGGSLVLPVPARPFGGVINRNGRGTIERRLTVGAFQFGWGSDLQLELSGARELEHMRVDGARRGGAAASSRGNRQAGVGIDIGGVSGSSPSRRRRRWWL